MTRLHLLPTLFTDAFPWAKWEAFLQGATLTLDRPHGAAHPSFPEIRYPLDYGYAEDTSTNDGDAVDVFVGSAATGLVGAILTHDKRKGDCEVKLLWNCTPEEIYCAVGFLNFRPDLLVGHAALRYEMREVWEMREG